jgi:hypothetical protein|tara:strand:- start:435 stop:692 length:258 start_codon:yes stop_codon:yes gene_type:complete
MRKFLILFVSLFFISGCSTTKISFLEKIQPILNIPEKQNTALTNAPKDANSVTQELQPVFMDEPLQIIAPDTSVSAEKLENELKS